MFLSRSAQANENKAGGFKIRKEKSSLPLLFQRRELNKKTEEETLPALHFVIWLL
jgi:hypothetical protein